MSVVLKPIPEDPQAAWEAGLEHGLRSALDLLESEARWQWELDARRHVGAQMVAQRLGVLMNILRNRLDGESK